MALLAVIGIAAKLIPVKIKSAEFYDFMEEQAQFAGRRGPAELKKDIMRRAEELEIPLNKKNLHVEKRTGRVRIAVTYTIPVEFPGYTYYWKFDQRIDRPIFIV
jgi:hypothetical protein